MAIATIVTRGYGNGTFSGTIPLVVTRGYSIGSAIVIDAWLPTLMAQNQLFLLTAKTCNYLLTAKNG